MDLGVESLDLLLVGGAYQEAVHLRLERVVDLKRKQRNIINSTSRDQTENDSSLTSTSMS